MKTDEGSNRRFARVRISRGSRSSPTPALLVLRRLAIVCRCSFPAGSFAVGCQRHGAPSYAHAPKSACALPAQPSSPRAASRLPFCGERASANNRVGDILHAHLGVLVIDSDRNDPGVSLLLGHSATPKLTAAINAISSSPSALTQLLYDSPSRPPLVVSRSYWLWRCACAVQTPAVTATARITSQAIPRGIHINQR